METVRGKGYRFKVRAGGASRIESAFVEAESPRIMLAVLPFENLSGDPGQEYSSDGLTEETIMRLGKMSPRRMGVIARTSSMPYKRKDKTVVRIGEELGVDYVLEGSVRREADRVRVTVQLIRVCDQIHLWAESFDRPPQSILDIHSEVGAAIAARVKLELTSEEERQLRSQRLVDQEAYDHYLHGRYHWARITHPELQKATAYFRKATDRDPGYALAYSGLADSLMIFLITSDVAPKSAFPDASAAISRALVLEPESVDVLNSVANINFRCEWY